MRRYLTHTVARWAPISRALIVLALVALSVSSCSFFTIRSGKVTAPNTSVLVTEQSGVTVLDRRTGGPIWQYTTQNDYFPPLIANNMVYVVSQGESVATPNQGTLEALNLTTGAQVWSWNWQEDLAPENAPILVNGVVYISENVVTDPNASGQDSPFQYHGFVAALRASDGRQLWKDALPGELAVPTVSNGVVYVTNSLTVLALRSDNGQQVWQYQPSGAEQLTSYGTSDPLARETPVMPVQGDLLYVYLNHFEGDQYVTDLVALDARTGRQSWLFQSHAGLQSLQFQNGLAYVVGSVSGGPSYVAALNTTNGGVAWAYRVAATDNLGGMALVGDLLYVSEATLGKAPSTGVVALRTRDGSVQQQYTPRTGDIFDTITPVVDQGILYLDVRQAPKAHEPQNATDTVQLLALSVTTSAELWRSPSLQPYGASTTFVAQGLVYVYSPWDYTPATLMVFQGKTGKQVWSYPASGWIYHVALM